MDTAKIKPIFKQEELTFKRFKNESCATNGAATARLADFVTHGHTDVRSV